MSPSSFPLLATWSWTTVDLVNHLWQSTAVAVVLLVLMALCRRLSARTRLTLGWMALLKFALPLAVIVQFVAALGGRPERWLQSNTVTVPAALAEVAAAPMVPFAAPTSSESLPSASPLGAPPQSLRLAPVPAGSPASNFRLWLLTIWLAGAAALIVPWIAKGLRLRRALLASAAPVSPAMARCLRSAANRAGVATLPRCFEVSGEHGPGLLGVRAPVLIVPRGLEDTLAPDELESVLLHEFVHLRRRDSLWGAFQVLAVGLLWFNPVVWLISRWIRLETEKSCDEQVLAIMHDPEVYARGILKVVHHSLGLPQPLLVSVTTPPVLSRIRNILGHGTRRDHPVLRLAAVFGGLAVVALSGHAGSLAIAATAPSPAGTPADLTPALLPANPIPSVPSGWEGQTVFRGTITQAVQAPPVSSSAQPAVPAAPSAQELSRVVVPILNRNDRDFARGEHLFIQNGCAMCHNMNGGTGAIGPDLAGVGGRFGVYEILQAILDPSAAISDLYGMKELLLANGTRERGRMVSENASGVGIVRTYTVDAATKRASWEGNVVRVPSKDIVSIEESSVSIMPPGLIDRLSTDELADLLAYIISGGDASNRLFRNFRAVTPASPPAGPVVLLAAAPAPAAPAAPTPPPPSQAIPGWDGRTVFRGPITSEMLAAPTPPANPTPPAASSPTPTYIYNEQRGAFEAIVAPPSAALAVVNASARNAVTVSFPNEEIRTVLLSVAELFDLNLVLPAELAGRTSLDLRGATWPQIFTTVLAQSPFTFRLEGNIVRVVPRTAAAAPTPTPAINLPGSNGTVTVDFPSEDIRSLLLSIAELFRLNVVVPDAVQGRTSIKLRNVTWPQIYSTVLDPLGYTFVQEGQIIRVVRKTAPSAAVSPESTEIVVIPLNRARAATVAAALAALVDPGAGGKVQTDERTNVVIVTERASRMNQIREAVRRLDVAP